MTEWSFLTNHARALLYIAEQPDARLRDLAAALGVTERTAFGIVDDLTAADYVVKEREGRRNRYDIRQHLPLPDAVRPTLTVGEILALLLDAERPAAAAHATPRRATARRAATRA